jgi:catechol 2,3-dioxygenase-like lactoylglutathione lyase family enzyme
MISGIECVTLGVRNLEAALALFRDVCGFKVESDTRASVSLLSLWGLAPYEDVRLIELSCDGEAFGRIRLARFPEPWLRVTRRDHGTAAADEPTDVGPKALDLYVAPPLKTAIGVMTAAGCELRAGPVRFIVRSNDTEEALLTGPADTPLLLMVGHRHPKRAQRAVPRPGRTSEVATVSVIVADRDATRRFYVDGLGLRADDIDDELDGDNRARVCRLFGVPEAGRVSLMLFRDPAQPSGKIQGVHFHDRTTRELAAPMRPGNLGISLFSTRCAQLETLRERLQDGGLTAGHLPIVHVALGDGMPARVMLARGPNGELFEFIER